MRHYVDSWRFRHPRRRDFLRAFADGAGADGSLSFFLERALSRPESVDYQIVSAETRKIRRKAGLFPVDGGVQEKEGGPAEPPRYTSEVVIRRAGELTMPVEVWLRFQDGSETRETWDGGAQPTDPRWRRFTTESRARLISAELAPLPLDEKELNNGLLVKPDPRPRRRFVSAWAQLLTIFV
jgi:hypothetical protein